MSTVSTAHCRICEIASGRYALGHVDHPWANDSAHVAFASIGALVAGWSLVAPRSHCLNLLDVYASSSFSSFAQRAADSVSAAFGSAVVFEHGGRHEGSATNCGTSHAHLHIAPLRFSLELEARQFDHTLAWTKCSTLEIKDRVGGDEYLFVADQYNGVHTTGHVCLLAEGQSQFFRRVIAQKLGRPDEANYRTHPNLETAAIGSETLRLNRLKAA